MEDRPENSWIVCDVEGRAESFYNVILLSREGIIPVCSVLNLFIALKIRPEPTPFYLSFLIGFFNVMIGLGVAKGGNVRKGC